MTFTRPKPWFSIALACGALLVGCGASELPTTPVELTFVVSGDVNPDASGRAAPIFVRYYQLGAVGAFERADYFQMHDKEAVLLGQDLLDRQDLPLVPGATQKVAFETKPGAKAIGVVASFRDIDKATWRADAPITPGRKSRLRVQVDRLSVSIMPDGR